MMNQRKRDMHTLIQNDSVDRAEAASAHAEVDAEIGDLCRTLEVPAAAMRLLSMPVFGAFMLIRMFKKLSLKIRELDERVAFLEGNGDKDAKPN